MTINKIFKLFLSALALILIIGIVIKNTEPDNTRATKLWNQQLVILNESTPQRITDLTNIAAALVKYKKEHKSYPISKSDNDDWEAKITKSGVDTTTWIRGLSPVYLNSLPVDPRKNNIYYNQYMYKSNGVYFKLIATYPEDCNEIRILFPKMIAPQGNCAAYGYWSQKAENW